MSSSILGLTGLLDWYTIPIKMPQRTTLDVAREIGVSKNTLFNWLRSGKLREPKSVQIGGMSVRVWSDGDLARAKKFKEERYRKRS